MDYIERDNKDSQDAQEVRSRSEFIRTIDGFMEYLKKEYIDDSDGSLAVMICAADRTIGDDRAGSMEVVMGGGNTMLTAVSKMMQNGNFTPLFRIAADASGICRKAVQDTATLRRRLRTGYVLAGLAALWTLLIAVFKALGVTDWVTTVTNLLLMCFVAYQFWHVIADLLCDLRQAEEEERNERRERADHAMGAFAAMMNELVSRLRADDDEE